MAYQRILTIQDISCVGQCSLTVALPILSACGHETAALPTAVLSTHTGHFQGYTFRDLTDDIPGICAHWEREGLDFSAVYTGYLASARQIALVRDVIRSRLRPGGVLIVDPAMADDGRLYSGFGTDVVDAMRRLCAEADYILPNVTEAALLAGLPYPEQAGSASEQIDCAYAERLAAGAAAHAEQTVLLTGVSFEPGKTGVFLWRDGKSRYYAHEKSPCGGYGTGDVFASAFTGTLLNGRTAERAARLAADYTARCAARTAQDPAHWYGLEFEPELPWLIRRLEDRE